MTIFTLFLFLLLATANAQSNADFYTAAVVEYAPFYDNSKTPGQNIIRNVNEYVSNIELAKLKNADIIVFPEDGLTTIHFVHDLQLYTSKMPDPKDKITPCNDTLWSDVLQRLSCSAQKNQIYVVINLAERVTHGSDNQHTNIYNTNIVFDRNGTVIARYRKFNLFNEYGFNVTDTAELVSFKTDFGVTFGTFICFDILFAKPALQLLRENEQVTDIVYPTAWFSQLPFLTAVQTQAGWARANGVNFLAAGYSNAERNMGGSGIYSANGHISISYPHSNQSTLIVSAVKKIKQRVSSETIDKNTAKVIKVYEWGKFNALKDVMDNYTTELVNDTALENHSLCHKKFCCKFTVKFSPQTSTDYYYRMIAYEGAHSFSGIIRNIQICGLSACKNTSTNSCGLQNDVHTNPKKFDQISISGDFSGGENSVIFPSNALYNLTILPPSAFVYRTKTENCVNKIEMTSTEPISELLAFGVYGVVVDDCKESSNMIVIIVVCVIIVVIIGVVSLLFARRQLRKNRLEKFN